MDLKETIDYVKQFYKQDISSSYDDSCITKIEISFCDGEILPLARITYGKVKLTMANEEPKYVRLASSDEKLHINKVKEKLNLPIKLLDEQIEYLKKLSVFKNLNRPDNGFDEYLQNLVDLTNYTESQILQKAGL
jgi:hypothetical protein